MKVFLNIIFVYIPFAISILLQVLLLFSLYSEETGDIAVLAKWVFPGLFLVGVVFYYLKKDKK